MRYSDERNLHLFAPPLLLSRRITFILSITIFFTHTYIRDRILQSGVLDYGPIVKDSRGRPSPSSQILEMSWRDDIHWILLRGCFRTSFGKDAKDRPVKRSSWFWLQIQIRISRRYKGGGAVRGKRYSNERVNGCFRVV